MTAHPFHQVDVFADGEFSGNPLAVIHEADDLPPDRMQNITRWTNLSEAAFLSQPSPGSMGESDADYRVRIFDPKAELPFAGHPTLGACAAWLDAGGVPRRDGIVVQECGAGLIEILVGTGASGGGSGNGRSGAVRNLAFAAPPMIRHEPVTAPDLDRAMRVLGLTDADVVSSHWIDNGPGWMGLQLTDARRVLDVEMPTERADRFDVGVVGLHSHGSVGHGSADIEVRAFFNDPSGSIREDPVTGSLNASIAQWLVGKGTLPVSYQARQTTGLVSVDAREDGTVWVGGRIDVRVAGSIDV